MREATHSEPIWRERSNFIIAADIDGDFDVKTEQLWARRIGERKFELCCIPFFVYDLALGDVVETSPKKGREYLVDRVVKRSGRYVFRVWFGESFHPRDAITEDLTSLGALLEWSSVNLLAVDAPDAAHAQKIADFLHEHEQLGHLVYETGRSV